MTRTLAKTLVALGMAAVPMFVHAQSTDPDPSFGWNICIDPDNSMPFHPDGAVSNSRANLLFRATIGAPGSS